MSAVQGRPDTVEPDSVQPVSIGSNCLQLDVLPPAQRTGAAAVVKMKTDIAPWAQRLALGPGQDEETSGRLGGSGAFWHDVAYWVLFIGSFATCGVLLSLYSDRTVEPIERLGVEAQGARHDPFVMIGCVAGSLLFNVVPLPGRLVWCLMVGFVYGWWGFAFLYAGHLAGTLLAFIGARCLWRHCAARCCVDRCTSAGRRCAGHCGRKLLQFVLASLQAVEERPLLMITVLALPSLPPVLLAYILAVKLPSIHWWQFMIPMILAGVKLLYPVWLATTAPDLVRLLKGDVQEDSARITMTVVVFALHAISAGVLFKVARRIMRSAQTSTG